MRVDPLRFAVLLPVLLVAHNVGDHIAQTDRQAAGKATDWRAMTGHVGSYQATQTAAVELVLAVTGLRCSRRAKLVGALFSAATHAVLDRRWPVRLVLNHTGSSEFARMTSPICGAYQADPALHHGCLLLAALIMAARRG